MTHSFFRRGGSLLLALALAFTLARPASAADGAPAAPTFELSAELDRNSMQLATVSTLSVTPSVSSLTPADSTVSYSYDWSVKNTSTTKDGGNVCTLSDGHTPSSVVVKASQAGTAEVSVKVTATATSGGHSTEKDVTISCAVTVPGIVVRQSSASILTRHDTSLTAEVYGSDMGTVTWSSGNESVATVSGSGSTCTVRGVSVGSTFVTASVTTGGGQTYSDTCYVTVNPVDITPIRGVSADTGSPLAFSSILSNMNAQCRQALDTSLSYVTSLSVPASAGTLYYGYISEAEPGYGVGTNENYSYSGSGDRILGDVTFVPKPDFSGTTTIRYTGFDAYGDFYDGSIEVSVAATSVISYSTTDRGRIDFQLEDFSSVCKMKTGHELQCVSFTLPSSSRGTLYYNYAGSDLDNKVTENTLYYRSKAPYLENISLIPAENYTGTFTIRYTGRDTSNISFSGTISITVSSVEHGGGDIHYSANRNRTVHFDVDDFNSLCRSETGSSLSYVYFNSLPSSSRGTLYYDYSSSSSSNTKVSTSTRYYRSQSRYLDDVSFVPEYGWSGDVDIPFTGYAANGDRFSGTVSITIGSGGSTTWDTITYSARKNGSAHFDADDFNDLCLDQTGARLNYVRFTLPSSSRGTLYYNYTSSGNYGSKVSASTSYYRASYPYLDNITFVPASNWTGTVDISFTGYSVDGDRFSGTVEVDVSGNSYDIISYTVQKGSFVRFNMDDFDNMCQDETGNRLSYVRFTLPSSSRGTLYYNYTSSGNYGSKVSASTSYRRTSSPYLDDVAFVPASDWTGTVNISFTGYSTAGRSFSGTVKVTVEETAAAGGIYLITTAGKPVSFQSSAFHSACNARGAGRFVSAVFSLPSANVGRLYYNYTSASQPGTAVSSSQAYRAAGSPAVSGITFVPAAGYTGVTTIPYTGTDSSGTTYSGTVVITVSPPATTSFTDLNGYDWAKASIEYLYANGVVNGTGNGKYSPSAPITRGSFMLMLCRAFNFSVAGTGSGFADVPADSVYADALRAAKALGIAQGSGGSFYPNRPLTREQAAVFLLRALQADGWTIAGGNRSTIAGFKDAAAVSDYAVGAVSAMVQYNILQGNNGLLSPQTTLTRAQMAVILHRALIL